MYVGVELAARGDPRHEPGGHESQAWRRTDFHIMGGPSGDRTTWCYTVKLDGGEAFKVKQQVVLSASEAAEMIVRVDDIIQCAPRARAAGLGGMGGMM